MFEESVFDYAKISREITKFINTSARICRFAPIVKKLIFLFLLSIIKSGGVDVYQRLLSTVNVQNVTSAVVIIPIWD